MIYGWSVETMVKAFQAGYRYHEVPVRYHRRVGVSKVSGTLAGSARWLVHPVNDTALCPLDAPRRRDACDGGAPMTRTLYVAAKAPRAELAKTRLGRTIGHERAVDLYASFLHDLAARFAQAPFALGWYVTLPDAWPEPALLVGAAVQGEGDWTAPARPFPQGGHAGRGAVHPSRLRLAPPHGGHHGHLCRPISPSAHDVIAVNAYAHERNKNCYKHHSSYQRPSLA